MPAEPSKKRQPGLQGVYKARELRKEGRFARPTEQMWLGAGAALVAILVGYWYFSGRSLSAAKDDLLAKRRSVMVTVGAEWTPLRDRIEKITVAEAGPYAGDFVSEGAKSLSFRTNPAIYLRLKTDDAKDGASIRKASEDSLKDAFAACLLRSSQEAPAVAAPDAGAQPEQPWNLRQAYASTRILTDAWEGEVKDSGDSLRLRVFQQQYDKAVTEEIPLAVDIIKHAKLYVLVLDEDTPLAAMNDAGKTTPETLQLAPHDARVVVYDLAADRVAVRLKRTASGAYMPAGERPITDDETRDAVQRQVNNCALAQAVIAGIGGR